MNRTIATGLLWLFVGCNAGSSNRPPKPSSTELGAAHRTGSVELVDGTILGVDRTSAGDRLAQNVRLTLASGDSGAPLTIELAPGWYLDERGLRFRPREELRVSGRSERRTNGPVFVAWEVKTSGRSVRFRDDLGRPLWQFRGDAGRPADR